VDRGKRGIKRRYGGGRKRHPFGHRHRSGQPSRLAAVLPETLDAVSETLGGLPEGASVHLDRDYDSGATRERLEERGLLAEISLRRASRHHSGPRSTGS
jgi:IS5 family transposase